MIEGKLAMTGRVTGFRAGDKQIQLNWEVTDGEGDFRREDIPAESTGFTLSISAEATMIIFIPGPQDLTKEDVEIAQAQEALDKAKEKHKTDLGNQEVQDAQTALNDAKKALEDAKVRISIDDTTSISGVQPTILTSDVGKAGSLKFTAVSGDTPAPTTLKNCEFIVL